MKIQPLILLGMHRSGTSLVSRLFENLGIFMGYKKDENNEALFFQKFNRWIFRQIKASWDNPYNYIFLQNDLLATKYIMKNAQNYLKSFKTINFLGNRNFIKYKGNLYNVDFLWGWKDPLNTYTVDIWIKIFPEAKIIHIYRNPIDVAESLRKREIKYRETFENKMKKEKFYSFFKKNLFYIWKDLKQGESSRVLNLDEGISLWMDYMNRALELEKILNRKIIHIKYESLLENPKEVLSSTIKELQLQTSERKIDELTKMIKTERRYAFIKNDELVQKYLRIKKSPLLERFGYDNII